MRADDLGALVRLYNDAVAAIPCNWPLTEAEFADALFGNGTLSSPGRRLDPETVYVAGAAGTPLGFVDFTLSGGNGLIRFLAFPPQRSEVGSALLTAALRHLCRAGCTHVEAWRMKHGYPFYTAWHGGCWEQSHLANRFLAHGFENYHREVVMHRDLSFALDTPAVPRGTRLEKTAESFGHDLLYCYAIHVGEEAATHATWHRMSALCRHPAAARHGYIAELGTAERYRRQGLGSTLMQQMIHDMHHAGMTEATLHTMYDNVPAIGLYTRHAFRYLGTSITLRKPLAARGGTRRGTESGGREAA